MKKCKKYCEEGCGALKLALIITGSIVAAAGIILLLLKLFKRKHVKLPCDCCCDDHESDFFAGKSDVERKREYLGKPADSVI